MANSRIALVAVRMGPGPNTDDPQAIVIGTMPADAGGEWNENDWRYVCYPLKALLEMLEADEQQYEDPLNPPDNGKLIKAATWALAADVLEALKLGKNGRLSDTERRALESVGFDANFFKKNVQVPTDDGDVKMVEQVFTIFPLRSIETVFAFSQDRGEASSRLREPFVALDTARIVNFQDNTASPTPFGAIPKGGDDTGSRITLTPDFTKPPGGLAAFSVHLEIKVAVNGHRSSNRNPADPRLLLDAGVVNRPQKLWHPQPSRGALFDVVTLKCTLTDSENSIGVRATKCDLIELAIKKELRSRILFDAPSTFRDGETKISKGFFRPDAKYLNYVANVLPATAALQLSNIDANREPDRVFGFRLLAGTIATPRKIGWRFEFLLRQYRDEFGQDVMSLLVPGWPPDKDADNDDIRIVFAQEQRIGDITFRPNRAATRTSLTVRLVDERSANKQEDVNKALTSLVFKRTDDLIEKIQIGLKRVRDGRPISLLPRLKLSHSIDWNVVGFLIDERPGWRIASGHEAALGGALIAFEPSRSADLFRLPEPIEQSIEADAEFAFFLNEERRSLKYVTSVRGPRREELGLQPTASIDSDPQRRGTRFALNVENLKNGSGGAHRRQVLIGAIELTVADAFDSGAAFETQGLLTMRPLTGDGGHAAQLDTALSASIILPIARATPGTQDDSESDVRITSRQQRQLDLQEGPDPFAPLLLRLPRTVSQDDASMRAAIKLIAEEAVTRNRDHTLGLALDAIEEQSGTAAASSAPDRVLIIDPRPFRIASVEYEPLTSMASSESFEVAVWNAEGEGGLSWRVRDDGQSVAIELPPQVLGEAMEKNRSEDAERPQDIRPGTPSAVRFGSPARMRIDPTFAETRFREPGWNLRRILGNALQRLPGARLLELRLELLYGLLARVKTEGLLITELAGAIGEPALPPRDTLDSSKDHVRLHKALIDEVLQTERFRLAIDKVYRTRPDEYLRIEEGTSFKLRLRQVDENGVLRGGPKTPLRWPVAGGIPEDPGDLVKPEVLKKTFSTSDRDSDSFPGGVPWAFESANILMSVYGKPQGDGGSVAGIYLGPHGGYGAQRALFDLRKSIIETETTQGRMQRYRLERVGRIGCLWHPAKHVIVYERTVVPSAQFYNLPPIGLNQDELAGRAILRKVEEYVEILKPKRSYPEDGTSIRASGCLIGAEFKSTKIRVDSSWGSDVRREGWQVPLWNTKFEDIQADANNPDDPASLYPKPQIRLTLAGKDKDCSLEIDEPAKLVFYTSVMADEDDRTDLWKPVRDIDFCDAPKVSPGKLETQSADLTDAVLPPEPAHVPGYERFTIGLVPSKDAVALANGRAADGPSAALRNLTIARSAALPTADQVVPELGRGLGAKVANVRAELDRRVGRVVAALEKLDRDTDPQTLQTQANDLIDQGLKDFDLAIDKIQGITNPKALQGLTPDCKAFESQATAYIEGQRDRFKTVAKAMLQQTADSLIQRLDSAAGVVDADLAFADSIAAQAERIGDDLKTKPAEEVKGLLDELRRTLDEADTRIKDLNDEAHKRVKERIAQAKKSLDDALDELRADLAAIRARTRADLKSVRNLLGNAVQAEADTIATEVNGIVAAAKSIEIRIGQDGNTITDEVVKKANTAKEAIKTAREKVQEFRPKAPEGVRPRLDAVDAALAKVSSAATYLASKAGKTSNDFKTLAETTRIEIETFATAFNADIAKLAGVAGGALDDIEKTLNALLDFAYTEAEKLLKLVDGEKNTLKTELDKVGDTCEAVLKAAAQALTATVQELRLKIPSNNILNDPFREKLASFGGSIRKEATLARAKLSQSRAAVEATKKNLVTSIEVASISLKDEVAKLIDAVKAQIEKVATKITAACDQLIGDLAGLINDAQVFIDQQIQRLIDPRAVRNELEARLKGVVADGTQTIAAVKARVAAEAAKVRSDAEARVRSMAASVQQTVQRAVGGIDLAHAAKRAEGVYQKGDNALRLIRAVGDPPKTDSLGFNRPEVAYVFGEAKELGIDVTPTLALVNRAADQVAAAEQAGRAVGELLDSFGVRLPITEIANQLIPDKLKNLSVSDLLPDMGGIDLKGLMQRVGFPDLEGSDAIKIRHGFDQAARRAWMEADLDVPFAESIPLLSFGPVQIMIDSARFNSRARLSSAIGSGLQRTMNGRIFGNWRVVCGGQTILTFRESELKFDDSGHIDFQIQPERVELADALKFVTDLMKATGQKGGLRIEPFMRGGVPAGVAATLDMVLPPIQSGAFGVSDLSLHVLFGVAAIPRFEIVSELAVGSRLTPFNLNVWILAGGGYIVQRLTYVPTATPKPLLTYTLDIAVVAGLGIAFSFGVVSGAVYLQVGCGIALTWTTGAEGNTTTVRVFLLARGNVDVAGIITASISLLFEIIYDGQRIIGAGTLSISVKISMFYTLSVDQHVEYVFAGEKKQVSENSGSSFC